MHEGTQINVVMESRGTITKLNNGHIRSPHTRPSLMPSATAQAQQCRDSIPQVQGQQSTLPPKSTIMKWPENSDQLAIYTYSKMEGLIWLHKIRLPKRYLPGV